LIVSFQTGVLQIGEVRRPSVVRWTNVVLIGTNNERRAFAMRDDNALRDGSGSFIKTCAGVRVSLA
jgi:hypothetical protein